MSLYVLAFLIGVIAGLRSLTAPAVVSWAASLGCLHLENTGLAFLGYVRTRYLLSVLAIVELVADKLPKTPSRKAPTSFAVRLVGRRVVWRGLRRRRPVADRGAAGWA
jgi:uncharacterized membrane protein